MILVVLTMGSLPRPARREPTLRFAAGSPPGADDADRPADCKRWASKAANMLAETNGVSLADVSTSKGSMSSNVVHCNSIQI